MKGDGPRDAVLKEGETSIRQGLHGLDARESAGWKQCGMIGSYSTIQFWRIGGWASCQSDTDRKDCCRPQQRHASPVI